MFRTSWFPHAFRWDATPYTFELTARTHKPYYPVASGTTTVHEEGDAYVLESKSDRPVDQVALFAGKYKSVEQMAGSVRVRVHMYLSAPKQMTETLPGLVSELLRFYQDQLGPYPFEELDIVGTPDNGLGIAPSGMALLPEETYKPMMVKQSTWIQRYLVRGAPPLIAHEVAHQWFGHKVSPATPEENWLAESFAEYMSGLAMGAGETKVNRVAGFKEMLADWRAGAGECADVGSLETANSLGGEKGFEDRLCLLYKRGPLVLHMFRTTVGDQNFFIILRKFLDKANWGEATTEDLKKIVQETLRTDMGWFFDQWFTQSGIPTIDVDEHVGATSAGGYGLSGKVTQPAEGFKKMIIPFLIEYPGGTRDVKLVFQQKPVQEFGFALNGKPSSVKVDPSGNNLALYK
jgi:aminopeptidase N